MLSRSLSKDNPPQLLAVDIRLTDISDIDQICNNERLAYDIPWTEHSIQQCLSGSYICFLMLYQGQSIGHMIIQQVLDEIHLHNVCIIPEFQNKGLGHRWLNYLNQYALQQEVKEIILEVRVSNVIAKNLYAKRGFGEIGLRKNYYQSKNGREDALVMKSQIGEDCFD